MRILRKLLERLEKANRQHGLLQKNDSLLVALSGGPDSTALLLLLSKLQRKYAWRIAAAHLNHGLNAARARRYQTASQKIAARLGIPFYSKKILLRSVAKRHKRSLEEMGRIERYRFFEETASEARAGKIVTAHTLDDQAETMLLRIMRGSGLRGLSGIPRKRRQGKFEVVRPLLSCEKTDLVRMLKEERVPYCVDVTNQSALFTRNRVRRDLLPSMERLFNPQIKKTLASLQTVCEAAQAYLDRVSERAYRRCLKKRAGAGRRICLSVRALKRLDPAVRNEVIVRALSARKGDLTRIAHHHIAAITEMI
ncbi:MAG: tRNA lysidine(34) synthetase TilS, partial [Candidatus Omnitrophota bacterium]